MAAIAERTGLGRASSGAGAAAGSRVEDLPQSGGCAVVLGSGFGPLAEILNAEQRIAYSAIPGLAGCSAPGHAGELIVARHGRIPILAFAGRLHLYEGLTADEVVAPIALARALGCDRVLLTCAAGATTEALAPGSILLIEDHLNMMGTNPLLGIPSVERDPRFLALPDAYDVRGLARAEALAAAQALPLRRGVLAALPGPSYETPAEYRALARLGADAVSMSIVLETIAARYLGLRVLALAIIANGPSRLGAAHTDGDGVLGTVRRTLQERRDYFRFLLEGFATD